MSFAPISNCLVALCAATYLNRKSVKPKEYQVFKKCRPLKYHINLIQNSHILPIKITPYP